MGLFRLYTSSDHHVPQVNTSICGVLLASKVTTNIRLYCIVFYNACDVGLYCIVFHSACLSVVVLLASVVMADRCWSVLRCFFTVPVSEVKRSQVSAVINHPCVLGDCSYCFWLSFIMNLYKVYHRNSSPEDFK